jgi:hypothetical protein
MRTYEVLERALGLIEDERNWWQCGNRATNTATGKCAVLAVGAALRGGEESSHALNALASLLDGSHEAIAHFNDTHSHAEVVALFQKAIRLEKQKAGVPLDLPDDEKTEDRKAEEVAV